MQALKPFFKPLIFPVLLVAGYSLTWHLAAWLIKSSVADINQIEQKFDTGTVSVSVNYDELEVTNFPFAPQLVIKNPVLKMDSSQFGQKESVTWNFNESIRIHSNMLLDEFSIIFPDQLSFDETVCYGIAGTLKISTLESLFLVRKLGYSMVSSVHYPSTSFVCKNSKGYENKHSLALSFIKNDSSKAHQSLFDLKFHHDSEDSGIISVDATLNVPLSSAPNYFLHFEHLDMLVEQRQLNRYSLKFLSTEDRGFTIKNQFEYAGKLMIQIDNYQEAFDKILSGVQKDKRQKTIKLLKKYANTVQDSVITIYLDEKQDGLYFGKFEQIRFLYEVFQTFASPHN